MASARADDAPDERPQGGIDDELIGLDPDDPETRAFAEHLTRMQRQPPGFTIEGSLAGVEQFADSANRAGGLRRLTAVVVVSLILLGAVVSIWYYLGDLLWVFFD
ncbi:hypothetical protein ALI22I_00430 [Saccharothrix sp. ALI-22-I]|uniref:hypothetical protein n=1 Tax=Saccharothrix sp. ALI-22-I TaxID=1933778 RepID=UPI00097C5BA8|nr:hypothetical protein [Saccharothrix sp. ALI-22-I]ONI93047.1 hypothetical protein ALI22I_00430 [Saccharothrix sp. ALI-22-I]